MEIRALYKCGPLPCWEGENLEVKAEEGEKELMTILVGPPSNLLKLEPKDKYEKAACLTTRIGTMKGASGCSLGELPSHCAAIASADVLVV